VTTTPHVYHIGAPVFCVSYRPGHGVHFIHARRGMERSTPVQADVDVDVGTGTVWLTGPEAGPRVWRNHDLRRLAAALEFSAGRAVWLPEYYLLQTAGRAGESYLFNLVRPQQWVPCRPPRRPPDTDVLDVQTVPGALPRPRRWRT
jgi:hypothetical protein